MGSELDGMRMELACGEDWSVGHGKTPLMLGNEDRLGCGHYAHVLFSCLNLWE